MGNGLGIAPPPRRAAVKTDAAPVEEPIAVAVSTQDISASPKTRQSRVPVAPAKFDQVKEDERVQFNKRITRRAADGFEFLSIRTRKKIPQLLEEALDLLEERYGKVG